jgi:hypothetical protein
VAVFAIVHKTGLKAGLNPGDDTLIDITFALLASGGFYIEVDQALAIDDCDP